VCSCKFLQNFLGIWSALIQVITPIVLVVYSGRDHFFQWLWHHELWSVCLTSSRDDAASVSRQEGIRGKKLLCVMTWSPLCPFHPLSSEQWNEQSAEYISRTGTVWMMRPQGIRYFESEDGKRKLGLMWMLGRLSWYEWTVYTSISLCISKTSVDLCYMLAMTKLKFKHLEG
jgi:hypothetical protein